MCQPRTERCSHTHRFGTLAGPPPPVLGTPWGAIPPGYQNVFRMVSSHQTVNLVCFTDSSCILWNPPTIFHPDQTAKVQQTSLSKFCALLIQQSHLFLNGVGCAVRGALLAKRPDSSFGEMHKGSCSGNIHMEMEKVEVKVQEDEVEDGRDQ